MSVTGNAPALHSGAYAITSSISLYTFWRDKYVLQSPQTENWTFSNREQTTCMEKKADAVVGCWEERDFKEGTWFIIQEI